MDASELDADVKLYKASGELLSEIQAKIPLLLKLSTGKDRKWVHRGKVEEATKLLDRFQEWPQLLDPYLPSLMQVLVDSFLHYCVNSASTYLVHHVHESEIIPLPRAVAHLLYSLCKVRGQKVIVRLLNNEPRYVEPLLTCFRLWGYHSTSSGHGANGSMIWEERYVMLLWLSHLMLAPFELSSISVLAAASSDNTATRMNAKLPPVAQNLLSLALDHINVSSKAREAASILAVRLALRGDMYALGLPHDLVDWAIADLNTERTEGPSSTYRYIGLLALLFGMVSSASDAESISFLELLLRTVLEIGGSQSAQFALIRDQAPARKLVVKIVRAALTHVISISKTATPGLPGLDMDYFLEENIQLLLEYLGDKDTPVRQAASKALSVIALGLDSDMSSEVVEAILGCLNENMLLEDIKTGQLMPVTDVLAQDVAGFKKNVNAVDPLKWHGAMLTLGHLLFRRSPPPEQLVHIIQALLLGLDFEQRSNVGTSIGVGVRDAACFGIWSLARKYSTVELNSVSITESVLGNNESAAEIPEKSTIQLIASHLVVSASLDPSGNLRRGSSAALQELIGRHPDIVEQGIPVVQVVDYHAVARRNRAMNEVAVTVSKLGEAYHHSLQYALLQWRGARATDAESRRCAAGTVGVLYTTLSKGDKDIFLQDLISQIRSLRASNVGSNAAARHGLLLSLASIVNISLKVAIATELQMLLKKIVRPLLYDLSLVTGSINGRVTVDVELVFEAIANFFAAALALLKKLESGKQTQVGGFHDKIQVSEIITILDRCTLLSDKDFVTEAASRANVSLLDMIPDATAIVSSWLKPRSQKLSDFTSKGRVMTLGTLFGAAQHDKDSNATGNVSGLRNDLILYFCELVHGAVYSIEIKVNALGSIRRILNTSAILGIEQIKQLTAALVGGLTDYTIDQRGDVGSNLRLASIEAAQAFALKGLLSKSSLQIVQLLVKLAAERLTKVRFEAWRCLKLVFHSPSSMDLVSPGEQYSPPLVFSGFEHQADVSSFHYYKMLLAFLDFPLLHDSLILGLMSSAAAGTEDISRASTDAVISMMLERDVNSRTKLFQILFGSVLHHLDGTAERDDRDVVPAIDFLTFLLEEVLLTLADTSQPVKDTTILWKVIQKVHNPSSSLVRLEALIRLYASMLDIKLLSALSLERLTRMLLHKWPKIRSTAATQVYLYSASPSIVYTDWHAPAAANKQIVVNLRKDLNVAGTQQKVCYGSTARSG